MEQGPRRAMNSRAGAAPVLLARRAAAGPEDAGRWKARAGDAAEGHSLFSVVGAGPPRALSLPKAVLQAGGIAEWNKRHPDLRLLMRMLDSMCAATTPDEALREVQALTSLGHNLWAYAYMRTLFAKSPDLFYGTLMRAPAALLPVVYTPTVGEACQKFGTLPMHRRGCYVSITDQGRVRKVLEEYAAAELVKGEGGRYLCDCIVFSDGGRILGLGDLGAWGMGIPIGKLDLYTVCAGVNPYRTVPVIIDAGCTGAEGNTDRLVIRDSEKYTGLKQPRVTERSAAGTVVNSAYYGKGNLIEEFMRAATELFGPDCLLQFEDFNSNDAFPLLATYREKFVSYNDDIQGTAAVTVAAVMGAMKLRSPGCADLVEQLRQETFLFHGAGSANIGTASLLATDAEVPKPQIFVTNSRGVIWRSEDGGSGNFRNDEQKAFAQLGQPTYESADLVQIIEAIKPACLIGAVGRDPDCFNKEIVEAMVRVNAPRRPVIFALSNPKSKAEITSERAYSFSGGKAIYGSGTAMPPVEVDGRLRVPGQVNNFYIFPGMSFGVVCCKARSIPERLFMVAAEAVAKSLTGEELAMDRVLPHADRIREVSLNVAAAVVSEAQALGLAGRTLGSSLEQVREALGAMMWVPGRGPLD